MRERGGLGIGEREQLLTDNIIGKTWVEISGMAS